MSEEEHDADDDDDDKMKSKIGRKTRAKPFDHKGKTCGFRTCTDDTPHLSEEEHDADDDDDDKHNCTHSSATNTYPLHDDSSNNDDNCTL